MPPMPAELAAPRNAYLNEVYAIKGIWVPTHFFSFLSWRVDVAYVDIGALCWHNTDYGCIIAEVWGEGL